MNILFVVAVEILQDKEMFIWISPVTLTIVSLMVDKYAYNGRLQLHIHFWSLGAVCELSHVLSNCELWRLFSSFFLFSCVQIKDHMQKLEEVKVEVSSLFTQSASQLCLFFN